MNDNSRMAEFIGTVHRERKMLENYNEMIREYEELAEYWQLITALGIATHEELEKACNEKLWGFETVNEVIKQKTGFENLETMWHHYKTKA